jgi:hypothetical protein
MKWTGQVYADCPTVAAQTYIEAPPARVWGPVSDIFLMAGRSAELQEVQWLDGVTGPAVGYRFLGRNANQHLGGWETVSTIIECDGPHRFAWAVGEPGHPWSTFRFTLRPDGTGTVPARWAQLSPSPGIPDLPVIWSRFSGRGFGRRRRRSRRSGRAARERHRAGRPGGAAAAPPAPTR